jgi:ferredoxin--NADP+ reductase
MTLSVAIVGSGPAGFYTAESLLKSDLDVRIDMIERLPTPFGLVRSGVAPDHQHTKRVERAYARTAEHADVRFYGHVELGGDLTLDELRGLYDAVVLATGAPLDRRLGIPGEDKANVFGSGAFVGWYNGHPDYGDLGPDLDVKAAAVVGNGNVALDIARVLVKTREEMQHGDMPAHAAHAIEASPLTDVHVLGRRGSAHAKFSNAELSEMGELADALPILEPPHLPDHAPAGLDERTRRVAEKNLVTFAGFLDRAPAGEGHRVHFRFWAKPVEVLGAARVEGVRLAETTLDENGQLVETGRQHDIACGLLVTAIGYAAPPLADLPFDKRGGHFRHEDGRIDQGLYCVGWCRRGPTGTIGTNKADGDAVARHIVAEAEETGKPGGIGLERLLRERGLRWVNAEDWHRIDEAEREAAPEGAPRRKFVRVKDMLAVLDRSGDAAV